MLKTVRTLAPAKVNLTFNITGTMPDGYHSVETLLQAIDLEDELTFTFKQADALKVSISCANFVPSKLFPCDESNLIAKAIRLFNEHLIQEFQTVSQWQEVSVEVAKHIPIGAGLAGGSADAAAALVAVNAANGSPLSHAQLCHLGQKLGADVPFCLQGGTAIGTGRGDILEPIEIAPTLFFCIVKPRKQNVSTPWAYKQYDSYTGAVEKQSYEKALKALKANDLEGAIRSFGNAFEPVIFANIAELAPLKAQLLDLGAWCCHLSGSGPALFAVVANREQAHYIRRKVLKNDDDGFEYGSSFESIEYGPPIEFHIAQSIADGARITAISP